MFYRDGNIYKSTLLEREGIVHGFSTRLGGVSINPHTATMNISDGLGDEHDVVAKNKDIFASSVSGGKLSGVNTVAAHQIHSAKIRTLTPENRGEGYSIPQGEDCDGFFTAESGILPIVKTADCTPILFLGINSSGKYAVAAVHAGWRGTVAGIAGNAVRMLEGAGCRTNDIYAAIGPHIGFCCYEVGEDFREAVKNARGERFAEEYVRKYEGGRYHADLTGMNIEILTEAGLKKDNIDSLDICTACDTSLFFSHRAMKGKRGTMGSGIAII